MRVRPWSSNESQQFTMDAKDILTWRHPHHGIIVSLSKSISCRQIHRPFVHSIAKKSYEAEPNQPPQLVIISIRYKLPSTDEHQGHREYCHRMENREEGADCVYKPGKSLEQTHVGDQRSPEKEVELQSRLDCANGLYSSVNDFTKVPSLKTYPSCTLLDMTSKRIRDGTKLEWLMDVCSLPACAQEHR